MATKRRTLRSSRLFFIGALFAAGSLAAPRENADAQRTAANALPTARQQTVARNYAHRPLAFERNDGQANAKARYVARGKGYHLYLAPDEATLTLQTAKPNAPQSVVRMKMVGANPNAEVIGTKPQAAKANYFIGNDPKQWRTNVPTFAKVESRNLYPGIDLVYYGNPQNLEYDFNVRPNANPKAIHLAFAGVKNLKIDPSGELSADSLRWKKPVAYQTIGGKRRNVAVRFRLEKAKGRVAFDVAKYDHSRPLVIDPILDYSTHLGGSDYDNTGSLAVDGAGNAYITGTTSSLDFPLTGNALYNTITGYDVFVTKLNPAGVPVYSTYLGGVPGSYSFGIGIAVDNAQNIYVSGGTYSNLFPIVNGYTNVFSGASDAFLTKIRQDGSAILYSTFYGGEGYDYIQRIAVDNSGNVSFVGNTDSRSVFPFTANAYQTARKTCSFFRTNGGKTHFDDIHSLDNVGFVNSILIDPHNLDTLFAGTDLGGFISYNQGNSWNPIPDLSSGNVARFVSNPYTKDIHALLPDGDYVSTDDGATFTLDQSIDFPTDLVFLDANTPVLGTAGGGVTGVTNEGLNSGYINALSYDSGSGYLFAATNDAGLYRINILAGDDSWTQVGVDMINSHMILSLLRTPLNGRLYVGTDISLYYSDNNGDTWTRFDEGIEYASVRGMTLQTNIGGGTLYAATNAGLFHRTIDGNYWYPAGPGVYNCFTVATTDGDNPDTYVGVEKASNRNAVTFLGKIDTTQAGAASLLYGSLLAGCQSEQGNGAAIDHFGNLYLCGFTPSLDFPVTSGAFQSLFNGAYYGGDGYVAKFNTNLNGSASLVYSTYLGGAVDDYPQSLAVDSAGSAYVTGYTDSKDPFASGAGLFPITAGAPQPTVDTLYFTGFVTKLNPAGSGVAYSTYIGGNGYTQGNAIIATPDGVAVVGGYIELNGLPLVDPLASGYSGGGDGFVTKINAAGTAYLFSTYFGGSAYDSVIGLGLYSTDIYIAGDTYPPDENGFGLPTSPGAFQSAYGGPRDTYIARITPGINPAPTLNMITPCIVAQGSGTILLTLDGFGFVSGSTVYFNNSPRTTTFVAVNRLFLTLTASDFTNSQSATIKVVNPSPGGGTSNAVTLLIRPARTFAGNITLDSCVHPQGTNVTMQFRIAGGCAFTRTVTLGANGAFSLPDIPAAAYNIRIKGNLWLAVATPTDLTNGNITNFAVTLPGGDANNDNIVDITDFGVLVNAFGSSVSDPTSGYDPNADFTCDGKVDIADFGVLVNNFQSVGDN